MLKDSGFVTFVIPSLNRPSLVRAIDSIIAQTDKEWECIVVFDGLYEKIEVPRKYKDKINLVYNEHLGQAGFIRNIGIQHVHTPWIAFLDDDDTIEPTYVAKLREYTTKDPDLKVVYFSIRWANGEFSPHPHEDVGMHNGCISYAVKLSLIKEHNLAFGAGPFLEDRRFFVDCKNKGKCLITYDPQYLVDVRSWWRGGGSAPLKVKTPLRFL